MEWLEPFELSLSLERKPLPMGHSVKHFCQNPLPVCPKESMSSRSTSRPKKKGIEALFKSIELHTRKSVQLNSLARNFAQSMASEIQAA